MAREDGHWKTNDLALAAYLSLNWKVTEARWVGSSCFWYFEYSDEMVSDVVKYLGGTAQVDPVAYTAAHAELKRTMSKEQKRTRYQGSVTHFDAERGFGFIRNDNGDDVYFHVADLRQRNDEDELYEETRVDFALGPGKKGDDVAKDIVISAVSAR